MKCTEWDVRNEMYKMRCAKREIICGNKLFEIKIELCEIRNEKCDVRNKKNRWDIRNEKCEMRNAKWEN